jgi:hypothetical protein
VRDDQRQRVLVPGANVDEVDVEAVDLGDELGYGVQPRLEPPEVVVLGPVARELLDRRRLHALRGIRAGLPLGPARCRYASAKVVELILGHVEVKGADLRRALGRCHVGLH